MGLTAPHVSSPGLGGLQAATGRSPTSLHRRPKVGPDLHAKAEAGGAGAGRQQKSATTLGDVLYARSKARVPEQDWAALIQSIAAGDQLALHALYERAHRMVFTLVMRITANRETAEELTIDCSMTCGGVRRVTTRPTALCSAGS